MFIGSFLFTSLLASAILMATLGAIAALVRSPSRMTGWGLTIFALASLLLIGEFPTAGAHAGLLAVATLVWSRGPRRPRTLVVSGGRGPLRMVGSVRSLKQCIPCHGGRRGDLLGAFSYSLSAAESLREASEY
jgi:hypothetical protein